MRIRRLVEQVDEQHREAMRTIASDLGELHFAAHDDATMQSRRRFVRRLGLGGVVAVGAVAVPASVLAPGAFAQESTTTTTLPEADLAVAEFAQGLELAASAAYSLAVETRLLSSIEAQVCQTFGRHHAEHAEALGTLAAEASGESEPAEGSANAGIVNALAPQLQAATSPTELFQVLYTIEEGAAATYASALGQIETATIAGGAASILPIESQHAVVIGELLELPPTDWLPAFQSTTGAFDPADYVS